MPLGSPIPLIYKSVRLDTGFRADIIVANEVIVEIKTVEVFAPSPRSPTPHLSPPLGCRVGLLINFNVLRLKDGLTTLDPIT